MSVEYKKLHETYRKMAADAQGGDAAARENKSKVMNEIRDLERQSAREGKILNAVYKGKGTGAVVVVETTEAPTKRSLQEEYVRKFDDEKLITLGGKEQTLRKFHSKRLLNK